MHPNYCIACICKHCTLYLSMHVNAVLRACVRSHSMPYRSYVGCIPVYCFISSTAFSHSIACASLYVVFLVFARRNGMDSANGFLLNAISTISFPSSKALTPMPNGLCDRIHAYTRARYALLTLAYNQHRCVEKNSGVQFKRQRHNFITTSSSININDIVESWKNEK